MSSLVYFLVPPLKFQEYYYRLQPSLGPGNVLHLCVGGGGGEGEGGEEGWACITGGLPRGGVCIWGFGVGGPRADSCPRDT